MDLVQFDRVSKRYVLGENLNAREALTAAARRVLGRGRRPQEVLWSLSDVSFTVQDGEALGIVGRNGAGKSTILKILAGITSPTLGVSRTRGRVAALLEVGTGFHPELSGRENVFLNGAILGMSRRDIVRKFDEIVDFAGTERFLDTPIKRYSSGMYLRLAFSVAAHLEPDVLVVDEILAVGDAEFQRKCVGRMAEAGSEGRTVVFVSHDLETLSRLCRRALWLEQGRVKETGEAGQIVRDYLASGLASADPDAVVLSAGPVLVTDVRLLLPDGTRSTSLMRDQPLRVQVEFDLAEEVVGLNLAVYVTTHGGIRVLDEAASENGLGRRGPGSFCAEVTVPPVLRPGDYSLGLWVGDSQEDFIDEPAAVPFSLYEAGHTKTEGLLVLDLPFVVEPVAAPRATRRAQP